MSEPITSRHCPGRPGRYASGCSDLYKAHLGREHGGNGSRLTSALGRAYQEFTFKSALAISQPRHS